MKSNFKIEPVEMVNIGTWASWTCDADPGTAGPGAGSIPGTNLTSPSDKLTPPMGGDSGYDPGSVSRVPNPFKQAPAEYYAPPVPREAPPEHAAVQRQYRQAGAAGVKGYPDSPSGPATPHESLQQRYARGGAAGIQGAAGGPSGPSVHPAHAAAPEQRGERPGTGDRVASRRFPGISYERGGGNPRLAAQRASIFEGMDKNPAERELAIKGLLAEGGKRGFQANLEQMSNYANARGMTRASQALKSGFFGPINRGQAQRHRVTPDERRVAEAAISNVRAGSNIIGYRTDQGMRGDPNYAREQSPHYRPTHVGGSFFADHPMFDRKGGSWAQKQMQLDAQANSAGRAKWTGSSPAVTPGKRSRYAFK
jgi:hypothetical protein